MRYYSSTSPVKTLGANVGLLDTTIQLDSLTGLPSGYPYTLVLDPDTDSEEIVLVTGLASGTILNVARGTTEYEGVQGGDGSSVQTHTAGSNVKHMVTARDLQEPQEHMAATSGVHGLTGDAVGVSDIQTLTNKTLTSPVINSGTLASPTITDATITRMAMATPFETATVSATALTGDVNLDLSTSALFLFTSNAAANFTLNLRGSSTATLNSLLGTNKSVTIGVITPVGTTAYKHTTSIKIDGVSTTVKWQGRADFESSVSVTDVYAFTVIKTASATYTVLGSLVSFA